MKLILFMVLVAALTPARVWADWQYTRWGMTANDVIAASGRLATKADNSKEHGTKRLNALLSAPYSSGRFSFLTRFLFDKGSDSLARVRLNLLDPELCHDLQGALYSKYGRPESHTKNDYLDSEFINWQDVENHNAVALIRIGKTSCSLHYWPLADSYVFRVFRNGDPYRASVFFSNSP